MKLPTPKSERVQILVFALILTGLMGYGVVQAYPESAWFAPAGAPPTHNVAAPINRGTEYQYKEGDIGVVKIRAGLFCTSDGLTCATLEQLLADNSAATNNIMNGSIGDYIDDSRVWNDIIAKWDGDTTSDRAKSFRSGVQQVNTYIYGGLFGAFIGSSGNGYYGPHLYIENDPVTASQICKLAGFDSVKSVYGTASTIKLYQSSASDPYSLYTLKYVAGKWVFSKLISNETRSGSSGFLDPNTGLGSSYTMHYRKDLNRIISLACEE